MKKFILIIVWMFLFAVVSDFAEPLVAPIIRKLAPKLLDQLMLVLHIGAPLLALILGILGKLPGTRKKTAGMVNLGQREISPTSYENVPRKAHRNFSHEYIPDTFVAGADRGKYLNGLFNEELRPLLTKPMWSALAEHYKEDSKLADALNVMAFTKDPFACVAWEFPPAEFAGEAHWGLLLIGPFESLSKADFATAPVRYFIAEKTETPATKLREWSPEGFQELGPGPYTDRLVTVFADMIFDIVQGKSRPSAQEVARRLLILKDLTFYAQTIPLGQKLYEVPDLKPEAKESMHQIFGGMFLDKFSKDGLADDLSFREREFLELHPKDVTDQHLAYVSWRVEAAQVLAWALGLLPELPPYDQQVSGEFLKHPEGFNIAEFIASAKLRDEKEIDRAREIAELWHWRSRTRQLQEEGRPCTANDWMKEAGMNSYESIIRITAETMAKDGFISEQAGDFLVSGKAYKDLNPQEWSSVRSITVERHFALNWLCGYAPGNKWDDTPTET